MVLTIVLVVVMMLVGSLAWLMPSPRERKQMLLRQTALKLGLHTKIVDLPTVVDVQRAQPMHCIAYGLSRPIPIETNGWQVAREHRLDSNAGLINEELPTGWYWSLGDIPPMNTKQYLKEILPTLSNDILAVESTALNTIIYWKEHGGVEQVEQIATTLKKLTELES